MTTSPDKPEEPVVSQEEFTADNYTFKILEKNVTWRDAQQLCLEENMTLASIPNTYIQAVLTVNVVRRGQPLWIGLFSEDVRLSNLWTSGKKTVYYRSDSNEFCLFYVYQGWRALSLDRPKPYCV